MEARIAAPAGVDRRRHAGNASASAIRNGGNRRRVPDARGHRLGADGVTWMMRRRSRNDRAVTRATIDYFEETVALAAQRAIG